ncbi:unnamed protein product, partial [Prunus brigantina]
RHSIKIPFETSSRFYSFASYKTNFKSWLQKKYKKFLGLFIGCFPIRSDLLLLLVEGKGKSFAGLWSFGNFG